MRAALAAVLLVLLTGCATDQAGGPAVRVDQTGESQLCVVDRVAAGHGRALLAGQDDLLSVGEGRKPEALRVPERRAGARLPPGPSRGHGCPLTMSIFIYSMTYLTLLSTST